jgi:hypothetical protein
MYLDLGEALVAFGLIFTVYQLRRPGWDVVLSIRPPWQRNLVWIFGGAGLLFTLLAAITPKLPNMCLSRDVHMSPIPELAVVISFIFPPSAILVALRDLPFAFTNKCGPEPFSPALIYQLAAYISFIAAPSSLMFLANRGRNLFNDRTAEEFYHVMVWAAAGSDERVNAGVGVLVYNFFDICAAIRARPPNESINQYARAVIDVILSDDRVAKTLTTNRLDGLSDILNAVERYGIMQTESPIGIPRLLYNLFYDNNSFLYKHLGGYGLAISTNIYDQIFASPTFLANFRVFDYPSVDYTLKQPTNVDGTNVFLEALSRSTKTYLEAGTVPAQRINDGLRYLSNTFRDTCYRTSSHRQERDEFPRGPEWDVLTNIAQFFSSRYLYLTDKADVRVAEREANAASATFYSDLTINSGIAAAIYRAFEDLTYIEKSSAIERRYWLCMELMAGMLWHEDVRAGYRQPFEDRMWKQIAKNLKLREYPAALRTYLEVVGYFLVAPDEGKAWITDQADRMRRLLYVDLKPLLDGHATMINGTEMEVALLPQSVSYKQGSFFYTTGFTQGREIEIAPPDGASGSAIEGLDLKPSFP